jgi:hypothetical protein
MRRRLPRGQRRGFSVGMTGEGSKRFLGLNEFDLVDILRKLGNLRGSRWEGLQFHEKVTIMVMK